MKKINNIRFIIGAFLALAFCACDNSNEYEHEFDYAPRATFTVLPGTFVAPGTTIDFSDHSTNSPTSWSWDMPGATPSTSTEQNPSVTYDAEGVYTVTLTVTNNSGESTASYQDYIEVSALAIPEEVLFNFENNLENEGSTQIDATLDPVAVGAVSYGTSHDGSGSYVFDGTNSLHLDGFKGITGSQARTIALWTKTPVAETAAKGLVSWGISGTGTRYSFKREVSGIIRIEWQGGGLNGTIPINDNNWHHVAVTWDGSKIILYVDGVQDTTASPTIINTDGSLNVEIGTYRQNPAFNYIGEMDDVRIDDVAYSAEKIKAIFEGTD